MSDHLLTALRECITEDGAHCLAYGTDTPKLRARIAAINETARAAIARTTIARGLPAYPVGTKFWGPHRRYLCTVVDVLTTTDLAGEVVQLRYVATHTFCGQILTDRTVCDVTIARNFVSAPARPDATHS